jgi:hypothetical protein
VLVAEDNADMRECLVRLLASDGRSKRLEMAKLLSNRLCNGHPISSSAT